MDSIYSIESTADPCNLINPSLGNVARTKRSDLKMRLKHDTVLVSTRNNFGLLEMVKLKFSS